MTKKKMICDGKIMKESSVEVDENKDIIISVVRRRVPDIKLDDHVIGYAAKLLGHSYIVINLDNVVIDMDSLKYKNKMIIEFKE